MDSLDYDALLSNNENKVRSSVSECGTKSKNAPLIIWGRGISLPHKYRNTKHTHTNEYTCNVGQY